MQNAIQELKDQLAHQSTAIAELVEDYTQNAVAHERLEELTGTLQAGQRYLENLVDEVSGEIDKLKRDMHTLRNEFLQIKEALKTRIQAQPKFAVGLDNRIETSTRHSSIPPAQRRLLSSIPPRRLTDDEAMELLQAVDRIVSGRESTPPSL